MATNKRLIKSNDEGGGAASFNTVVYSGNQVTGTQITNVGFQPDFVWIKDRGDGTHWHNLFDSVRGASERLFSNTTSAESFYNESLQSFDNDGFTVGLDPDVNRSGTDNMVAWCWKAGGSAVTNTDGTITSQVSANTEAGFSVVSYTGNGIPNSNVGHGLGLTPKIIITKLRSDISTWLVTGTIIGLDNWLFLDQTNAIQNASGYIPLPTNNVISLGSPTTPSTNSLNYSYIAYCFAEVAGFSKFGSYTGVSSGVTINVGFEPAFVMVKSSSNAESWVIVDNKRTSPAALFPNGSDAEYNSSPFSFTFTSTGFSFPDQAIADSMLNQNGYEYIYMAFANQF